MINDICYKILKLEDLNAAFRFLREENYNNLIDENDIYAATNLFLKNDFGFILYDKKKIIGVWIMFKSLVNNIRIINLSTMYLIKKYRNIYFHIFNKIQDLEFDYIFNTTMDTKLIKVHEKFGFKRLETNQIFFIPKPIYFLQKNKIEIRNIELRDINSLNDFGGKFVFCLSNLKKINCVVILSKKNFYLVVYRIIKYKNFINIVEILYTDERKECQNLLKHFYKYCLFKHKSIFFKTYDYICNVDGINLFKKKELLCL